MPLSPHIFPGMAKFPANNEDLKKKKETTLFKDVSRDSCLFF